MSEKKLYAVYSGGMYVGVVTMTEEGMKKAEEAGFSLSYVAEVSMIEPKKKEEVA